MHSKDYRRVILIAGCALIVLGAVLSIFATLPRPEKAKATANTYYVSNVANNGYAIGSDSNNGTSKSTPFLTINKALTTINTAGAAGSTVNINPSGTAYAENTSSQNFGLRTDTVTLTNVTVQTDQTLLGSSCDQSALNATQNLCKAVVQGGGSSDRVLNTGASNGLAFNDIIFDAQNKAANVSPHVETSLTFTRCNFRNTAGPGFNSPSANTSGAPGAVTFDQVNFESTATTGITITNPSYISYTVSGSTFSSSSRGIRIGTTSGTNISLHITNSGATRSTFNGAIGIEGVGSGFGGSYTTIEIDHTDFTTQGFTWTPNVSPVTTITNFLVHDNTYSGTQTTPLVKFYYGTSTNLQIYNNTSSTTNGGLADIRSENVTNAKIHDNTASTTSSSGTPNDLIILASGSGAEIYNNTLTTSISSNGHAVMMGSDGYQTSNILNSSGTTTHSFGDSSSNTYIDQKVTFNSGLTARTKVAGFDIDLAKVGSPTGTVTAKLYSDSAGSPGTLLDTATYSLTVSNLSTSMQTVRFYFGNHPQLTISTVYHFVFQISGGTTNGSNYVTVSMNTASNYSGGNLLTSSNGSSWTSESTNSSIFTIRMGNFLMVEPKFYNNTVSTLAGTESPHMVMFGNTTGGIAYNNKILMGGIGILFKEVEPSTNNIAYNNVIFTDVGTQQGLRSKGSNGTQFIHNTVIVRNASAAPMHIDHDFDTGVLNTVVSQNIVVKNNIFYRTASSISYYVYVTESVNVNTTIDYNVVYNGSNTTINNISSTWAAWQAAGYDVHGVNADPLLAHVPTSWSDYNSNSCGTTPTNCYALTSTSPAIDAAVDMNITTGLAGKQRYDMPGVTNTGSVGSYSNNYDDIGAYEYVTPPTPTLTSSTHPSQSSWYTSATPTIIVSPTTTTTTYRYTVDQTASPTLSSVLAGIANSSGTFTIGAGTITGDGVWYVHVAGKNLDGDSSSTYNSYTINYDVTSPASFSPSASASYTNATTVSVTFSTTDATSGIASYSIKLDSGSYIDTVTSPYALDVSSAADGTHTVTVKAIDSAGNNQTSSSTTINLDRTAPVDFTPVPSPTSWTSGNVTLTFSTTDATSGIASYKYKVDSGSYSSAITSPYVLSTTDLDDGTHSVTLAAVDVAGNTREHATTIYLDRTSPLAFSLTVSPTSWSNAKTATLTFSTTDPSSGVANYTLSLDTSAYGSSITSPYELDTSTLADGVHTLSVKATDNVGNYIEEASTLSIDRTIPTASLSLSPSSPDGQNGYYKTVPTLTLAADDTGGSGNPSLTYHWDSGTDTTYSDTLTAPEGNHTVSYYATDGAGNSSGIGAKEIKLDSHAPSVSSLSTATATTSATLSWETDEETSSQIAYGKTSTYSASSVESDTTTRVTHHSVSLLGLSPCTTYHFRAQSTDQAGNQGISNDTTFKTTGCSTATATTTTTPTPQVATDTPETTPLASPEPGPRTIALFKIRLLNSARKPLSHVKVILHSTPQETITDTQGFATFTNVEQGKHQLEIAYGKQIVTQEIDLANANQTTSANPVELTIEIKAPDMRPYYIVVALIGMLILAALVALLFKRRQQTIG